MAGGFTSIPGLWPWGRWGSAGEPLPPEIVVWPETLPEPAYTLQLGSGGDSHEVTLNHGGGVGFVSASTTYATARAMGSTSTVYGSYWIGQNFVTPNYSCYQLNGLFDFGDIPLGAQILSVVPKIYCASDLSATDFTIEMRAWDWATTTSGVPGANLASYQLLASLSTAGIAAGWLTLTAEAALALAVAGGGALKVNFSSSRQRGNNTPVGSEYIVTPMNPAYTPRLVVTYATSAGDEVTLEIDAESLVFGSGMRGFASLECEADLETCNDVVSNKLVLGIDATLFHNGVPCWQGEVVSLPRPSPDDPVQQIIAAGAWDKTRRNESYCKWFVSDSTYDRWRELPVRLLGDPSILNTRLEAITVDTDRQILITIPNGTVAKIGQGVAMGFWLFDGQDPSASLSRVTCDVAVNPGATQWIFELYAASDLYGGPQAPLVYLGSWSAAAYHTKVDQDLTGYGARALILYATAGANHTAGLDYYLQLRNLVVYAGTQAARRIDEAIVEIIQTDSGIAASSVSSAIGSALTDLVVDPDTTIADAVEQIEARHSLPVLSGIWEDRELVVMEQPSAPTDRTRYYEVSVAQAGVVWDVQPDEEADVEVVKVLYQPAPENECLDPHPSGASLPASWTATAGCSSYNEGDGYVFRLFNSAADGAPIMEYRPSDGTGHGIAVTPGVTYLARCRALINGFDGGQAHVLVRWFTSDDSLISQAYIVNATADAGWAWYTTCIAAPADAAYAVLIMRWYTTTTAYSQALRVRDVEFEEFVDSDVQLVEYVPAPPSSPTTRIATIQAGYRTRTGAIAAGQQYLAHYSGQASGTVQIPDYVHDVDGRLWPLSHIRAWDWVICTDYHDPDARGPFMVTNCEVQNDVASLGIGGVDTYAYDPPEKAQARRGRFVGGKYIWKKVRRKVKGRWRWVKRKVWRKARYR